MDLFLGEKLRICILIIKNFYTVSFDVCYTNSRVGKKIESRGVCLCFLCFLRFILCKEMV